MKSLVRALIAMVALVASVSTYAFGVERFVEGVHYSKVENGSPMPGTVIEFFSFGCPHCAHLEPAVEAWLKRKPASANFSRIPATWNARFQFLGQVYYTLEKLGVAEANAQAMFDHIHKDNKPLRDEADVADFMAGHGVSKEDFTAAWNSEEIRSKLVKAGQALGRYKVSGVPSFLVGGQYMTSLSMAGSEQELFDIIEFLLTK